MYRPDRGQWLLALLAGFWGGIAMMWRRPATPPSTRARVWLRIGAVTIAIVSLAAGVMFAIATFAEPKPWTRWMMACLTFGLFGFPSSLVAIIAGALLIKSGASQGTGESACAVFLAVTYFAQWLLIAASLWRRSMW